MKPHKPGSPFGTLALVAGAVGALTGWAALVARSARKTERSHPPDGRFIVVRGVRLHYVERGDGPAVVLLHGNGVTAKDWEASGVLDALSVDHRVIAFDRPGFGYSERPRNVEWSAAEQAELLHAALVQLGVERPVVVGHSWGTLVALALALDHPADVDSLVLLSGYYYPSLRIDALTAGLPAIPLLGDVLRYTLSPVVGRLLAPVLVGQLFAPAPVPERFANFPFSMSLRPSQLRSSAQDSLLMVPSAGSLAKRYTQLTLPVTIIAGRGDLIANPVAQSNRLAQSLGAPGAQLVEEAGHMVHYVAPGLVVAAVKQRRGAPAASATLSGSPLPG